VERHRARPHSQTGTFLFILIYIFVKNIKMTILTSVLAEQFAAPKLVELAAEPTKTTSEAEPVITPGGRQAFRLLSGSGWSMPGQSDHSPNVHCVAH
jgi:hypothetical protein